MKRLLCRLFGHASPDKIFYLVQLGIKVYHCRRCGKKLRKRLW